MDGKLALFNILKSNNVYILGDINIYLNLSNTFSNALDCSRLVQSHAYFSIITSPTRVTTTSQTVIDHILTNDNSSIINSGVLLYKISDQCPVYCTISQPISNKSHFETKHTYRNIHSVDGDKFCSDLEISASPILHGTSHPTITPKDLEDSFVKLAKNITEVKDHHASVLTASRKQKRWQIKAWLTKGLII